MNTKSATTHTAHGSSDKGWLGRLIEATVLALATACDHPDSCAVHSMGKRALHRMRSHRRHLAA
jgi:hypothetical protein